MNDKLFTRHSRSFHENRFVYPVVSRRSHGISIGVNLNPDKVCNFDCIYCQVDRTRQSETKFVELDGLLSELRDILELVDTGELFETDEFRETPEHLRRLNDIAFSGDGEPTTYRNFDEIIGRCADLKRELGLSQTKMVLITNASMFHRPHVQRGLEIMDQNEGEIWGKLDAGTEEYFQLIDRSKFRLEQIMTNLTEAAKVRPIVIQSLFMKVHGEPPSDAERDAFCERLNEIVAAKGSIKLVQIYTIARRTTEDYVQPLQNDQVDAWVAAVREATGLNVEGYYGVASD